MKKIRLTVDIEVDEKLLEVKKLSIEEIGNSLIFHPDDVIDGFTISTDLEGCDCTEGFFIKEMSYVSHEIIDDSVQEISPHEARMIIDTRKPQGKFWFMENGKYIGIDNCNGEAWMEEFDTAGECFAWLNGGEDYS